MVPNNLGDLLPAINRFATVLVEQAVLVEVRTLKSDVRSRKVASVISYKEIRVSFVTVDKKRQSSNDYHSTGQFSRPSSINNNAHISAQINVEPHLGFPTTVAIPAFISLTRGIIQPLFTARIHRAPRPR
jgi:hypothetical protein